MKATQQPTITPVSDPMRPSMLLRGAAIYLQKHGWTRGQFFELLADTDQHFLPACASGAIMTAAHGYCPNYGMLSLDAGQTPQTPATITAMRVFAAYLDPEYDFDHIGYCPSAIDIIGDWNDEQGRTLDEVLEALTDAADDWDTEHPTGGAR